VLERIGERIALECGAETLSYRELAGRVRRSAAALSALGVVPGDRVLLLMRDTPEFAAAWLGAVRMGAVAVALNNRLSETEYRHVLKDSGARIVVVEDVFVLARPDLSAELAAQGRLCVAGSAGADAPGWRTVVAAAPQNAPPFDAEPGTPAFCLYSSGTTGQPKGVLHSHYSIGCVGEAFRAFGLDAGDRVFSTSRLFFAYGLEHGLLAPLALGACSVLFPDWPDADAVLEVFARHRPSAIFSVPTTYRRLLAEPHERLQLLAGTRRFVAAGERLSAQLVAQWHEATGGEILNLYGMSETFCACMVTPPGTSDGLRTGRPLGGVETRLLDAEGALTGGSDPALLWIRHPAQASGYVNLPDLSREQFQDGWFCTRDMFSRDAEGFFVHQGRSDDLVKIAGLWVQPAEVEEAATADPDIVEAACVPMLDHDGLQRLALFVTAGGTPAQAQAIATAACERSLPGHKRPKWVRAIPELPRTATGKVQRFKLREILERELGGKD
jgi:acyl-coenzyme A synthetase/AMP-(fatty) acid ligase